MKSPKRKLSTFVGACDTFIGNDSVVCPLIDIIDPDNFKYVPAPVCMGGFNWGLFFKSNSL